MTRTLATALLLVPSIGLSDSSNDPTHQAADQPIHPLVQAQEVAVGFGGLLIDGAYLALNLDANRPNYVYGMHHVLENRSCESFNDLRTHPRFAFVTPVADTETGTQYLGIEANSPDQINSLCKEVAKSGPEFAKSIDTRLFDPPALASILKEPINWELLGMNSSTPNPHIEQCAMRFMSAELPRPHDDHTQAPQHDFIASAIQSGLAATSPEQQAIEPSQLHMQTAGLQSTNLDPSNVEQIWRVQPANDNPLLGTMYVTSESPSSELDETMHFTAWYAPPLCTAKAGNNWFIVTDRPIKRVKSEKRANLWSFVGYTSQDNN